MADFLSEALVAAVCIPARVIQFVEFRQLDP
jgi:hypothetical protein